jgi:chorismate synthase
MLLAMGSSFGRIFRIATFGESHGGAVGVVVDGCPPRLPIAVEEIQQDLDRRKPGQSRLTTSRRESDQVEILSGLFEGRTLGTPIAMLVRNQDARPQAYEHMKDVYRPSHADYTTEVKYGIRNWQGGGRASARETVGRVAAGAVARKLLRLAAGVEVLAWVRRVHEIEAKVDPGSVTREAVESNIVRCPEPSAAEEMAERIVAARKRGDSLGGVVECAARGVPAGLGEPVFDKLEADLARGLMSLPASKGFEIGSGFEGTRMTGIGHNDPFTTGEDGRTHTTSNRSGGVQGGITNGEDIVLRVAFKPTATISQPQQTVDRSGEAVGSPRAPRPVRPAARGTDRGGHGLPGPRRPLPAPARRRRPAPADLTPRPAEESNLRRRPRRYRLAAAAEGDQRGGASST